MERLIRTVTFGLTVLFLFVLSLKIAFGLIALMLLCQAAYLVYASDEFPIVDTMLGLLFLGMFTSSYAFANFETEVVPYTGIIIYTALLGYALLTMLIRKPFTGDYVWTSIWALSFLLSASSGYLLMPGIWYFYTPFIITGTTAVINVGYVTVTTLVSEAGE